MISVPDHLAAALREALAGVASPDEMPAAAINACQDPRFGDYQSNTAMPLAKKLGKPPREVAGRILERLKVDDLCEKVEIAGAGFLNFRLKPSFIANQLKAMAEDPRNGIRPAAAPRRMVIDFSSPNIAKAMHVGHIRSTFLGDALARLARAVGHTVITDNHLGDWGTQFGKLIYGYKKMLNPQALAANPVAEFERLYKEAHALSEKDETILTAVRQELANLQAGDAENLRIWKDIASQSLQQFDRAYQRLGVSFDHTLGESFYNPMLKEVVDELLQLGLAEKSQGAACIFFRDNPALKDAAPMIIQKADGAALYATTDLATVLYRVREWKTDEILYVTDARQQLHFKQLFAAVEKWFASKPSAGQWRPPVLRHVVFGSILGPDKRPIKTRSGESIKLEDLLDEAESRALQIVTEKNPALSGDEKRHAARVIGLGALKYADLCQNRNLDYLFDWNKLLALQGNTAPYLIYAYVRIRSIFRSAGTAVQPPSSGFELNTPEEWVLARHLIRFSDTLHEVLEDCRPHLLAAYLYDLACKFSRFYEACPVLKEAEPLRSQRLALCEIAARTLKTGLNLMGIETLEKM
ncbi:MAG: arginine--tRNA ligase [Verrucomicrobiae bacterium]|nr:arginine--tRNA ligase [Verrucomicrobiae bacterium]